MTGDQEAHLPRLAQVLQQLERDRGKLFATRISQILNANILLKRHIHCGQYNLEEYVALVVARFDRWHNYVDLLQTQRDGPEWSRLIKKLRAWAYRYLKKRQIDAQSRNQFADDIANQAGCALANAHFPFDVDFDQWAYVLTRNVGSKHMRLTQRMSNPSDIEVLPLSEVDELKLAGASSGENPVERQVARDHDLIEAIKALSPKRYQVIVLRYYHGKSMSEIADILQVKRNTVYKRHFDALNQLNKRLG